MNRRSLLAVLATLPTLARPAVAQSFVPYEAAAFSRLIASAAPIVVHVHADWCPTCRAQQPTLQSLARDPALASVRFVRVDFDRDRDFLRAHRVSSQSTILVFRGGRVVTRMIGTTNANELDRAIRRAVA